MYRISFFVTAIVLLALIISGCESLTGSSESVPPELPSVETMEVEFSLFETTKKQTASLEMDFPYSHFFQASKRALFLQSAAGGFLAVPAVVLTGAEAVEPELNESGEWEWNYTVTAFGQTADIRLVGAEQDGQNAWDFYITQPVLDLDDQLLFTGSSAADNSTGNWIYLNALDQNNEEEQLTELTWDTSNSTNYLLQHEILTDRDGMQGDMITVSRTEDLKQAGYSDASETSQTEIEWNLETYEGFLIAPNYNDGEKACWKGSLVNAECLDSSAQ